MASVWISSAELTEIIGTDSTSVLQRNRGGVSLYIPKTPTGFLLSLLGTTATTALCYHFGGEYIVVPMGKTKNHMRPKIVDLLNQKQSYRKIALQLGVTERYVEMVAEKTKRTIQQLRFF